MLTIGIHYLCGWSFSTHSSDRERPEWPPHPDRVFMALVAAHFETDGSRAERSSLEWLEQQSPPAVAASDCTTRSIVTAFVPVNDTTAPRMAAGKKPSLAQIGDGLRLLPERRSRQPRQFPTAIPFDKTVYLVWQAAEPTDELRNALAALCRKVTYVGHSASMVQMWLEKDQDAILNRLNYFPSVGRARTRLRVTSVGRLADLEVQFNQSAVDEHAGLSQRVSSSTGKQKAELKAMLANRFGDQKPIRRRPSTALSIGYSAALSHAPCADTLHSVFDADLVVLRRIDGRTLGLESTLAVTTATRGAVLAACPVSPPPEWISGHKLDGGPSERPHLAIFPLPHVGRDHADGHQLGVGLAIPRGISNAEQAQYLGPLLFDAENEVPREFALLMGAVGAWQICQEDRDQSPVALRSTTWTRPARRWATVTPIVLDRHSKTNDVEMIWKEAEDTIATACERIGLPRPRDVIVGSVSLLVGVPHARRFPLLQRKTGGNLHHTHAIITFDSQVQGPVLVGAGRYRGYGLCRPWDAGVGGSHNEAT